MVLAVWHSLFEASPKTGPALEGWEVSEKCMKRSGAKEGTEHFWRSTQLDVLVGGVGNNWPAFPHWSLCVVYKGSEQKQREIK